MSEQSAFGQMKLEFSADTDTKEIEISVTFTKPDGSFDQGFSKSGDIKALREFIDNVPPSIGLSIGPAAFQDMKIDLRRILLQIERDFALHDSGNDLE